uniref:Small ribosomal subunit protein uS3m n=1 Tax=Orbilia brochopaga TaxID=3140254 RepID=A0A4Y5MZQ9_9PEZI|nr:ribosomal protein S3 [Drechslerella brochopaga]
MSFSYLVKYNLKKIYLENLGVLSQIGRDRLYPTSKIIMDYIKNKDIVLFQFLTKYFFKKHKYNYRINKLKIWLLSYLNRYSKKKIEINLIRLKYIYLNSNMVAEYITRKLITKRRSLLKVKRKIFTKAKLVLYNKYIVDKFNIFNINDINLLRDLSSLKLNNYFLYKELLKRIKYKFISGIRLIATGRLTRRNIAARSVKSFCYKGSLKNIDSSFKFLSVASLRGDWRPNLEFTAITDTAKTGSFGVKTWISYYSYSTSSVVSPEKIYSNSDTQKMQILQENKGKSGVYRWINLENRKSYVGSATNLSNRFRFYYSLLSIENFLKKFKSHIFRALLKYGYSSFQLEILEYCDPEDCIKREQYYIDLLKPEYNILKTAGSSLGLIHTEKTREILSALRKGKKHSAETLAKISEASKGEKNPMFGKLHNEKTRTKISDTKGTKVLVFDLLTKNFSEFNSIRKAAEKLNAPNSTIRNCVLQKKIYKDRYEITIKK